MPMNVQSLWKETHTISEPIIVGRDQILDLTGVNLLGSFDGPMVVLDGDRARLKSGWLISSRITEGPIIHQISGFNTKIEGVRVQGSDSGQPRLGIGLQIDSPIAGGGSQATSYFATIRDLEISLVKTGILLTEQVNGAYIENVLMHNIADKAYHLRGTYGTRIIGGSEHGGGQYAGPNIWTFYLEPKSAGKTGQNTSMCSILGNLSEPGQQAHSYYVGPGCTDNHIISQLNCSGSLTDTPEPNKGNFFIRRGILSNTNIAPK